MYHRECTHLYWASIKYLVYLSMPLHMSVIVLYIVEYYFIAQMNIQQRILLLMGMWINPTIGAFISKMTIIICI